jgi:small conductance mechanosensitive channel
MEVMPPALIVTQMRVMEVWAERAVEASVYLGGAAVLSLFVVWGARRFAAYSANLIQERGGPDQIEMEKQTATIITLVRRILLALIWTLAVILALEKFQFDVKPLLAGAGVATIAIGFAAQSILKDWINGFFLITEGQIRIHDVLKIGEFSGAVEKISLRTLSLRSFDGVLHVISNGTITTFSNMTMTFSYAVFEVPADYGQDTERMMDLMRRVDESMRQDPEFARLILEPIEIVGVDRFTEQGVVVKARLKTQPSRQWPVGREFNRRLKALADAEGVVIATAKRAVSLTPGAGGADAGAVHE